jgi:nicotinamide mononucleotide transporter
VLATLLMAKKRLECWVLWILVDLASIVLYATKGIHLIALEYFIFLIMCLAGFSHWLKRYRHANRTGTGEIYARS